MTRNEAIQFIENSKEWYFNYGYDAVAVPRNQAIHDIRNMDEEAWNDGVVHEVDSTIDHYVYSGIPSLRMIDLADSLEGQKAEQVHLELDDWNQLKKDFTFFNKDSVVLLS